MLVQIQSSALVRPDGVAERIGPSEGPGPGSNPGRDTDSRSLRVCRIARQSSKLQDEVQLLGGLLRDLRPRGVLDWHATLRRLRSRFDSWRGRLTLEPDGTAAACKAALQWVRLPPASLTNKTTGSSGKVSMSSGQRRTDPLLGVGQVRSVHGF
jgi:hypothetical protein